MQNPTRRLKRHDRPPTGHSLPQTNDTVVSFDIDDIPGYDVCPYPYGDDVHSHDHVRVPGTRHRPRIAQPRSDTLVRGAVLVTLIMVTLMLYVLLWKLERSDQLASIPIPRPANANSRTALATTWTVVDLLSLTMFQDGLGHGRDMVRADDTSRVAPSSQLGVPSLNTWPPLITHVPEDHEMREDHNEHRNDDEKADKDTLRHEEQETDTQNKRLDAAYCHGTCRFLLPVRIGEQESKARIHFTQLLMLAQRLGRTLVLPHVGKSRMSACAKLPFDAYYDMHALAQVHRGDSDAIPLPTMDLERFATWVDTRPVPPSAFVVSMVSMHQGRRGDGLGTPTTSQDVPFVVSKIEIDPKMSSCLASRLARLRSSLPETALSIAFQSNALKTGLDASTRLVQLLSGPLNVDMDVETDFEFELLTGLGYDYVPQYINGSSSLADINVFVLDYDLRRPLFDAASTPLSFYLHYTPTFYDLADRLADNVGPFLGIHWRMETVPVQHLAWCAAALISTLEKFLRDDVTGKHIQHVWLATDHPRPLSTFKSVMDVTGHVSVDDDPWTWTSRGSEDGIPDAWSEPAQKSSTFTGLSSEHDDAITMLAEAFHPGGDLDAWTLTDLAEQLHQYPYVEGRLDVNDTLLSDPGVFGIIDKLVIVQASVFLSGSTDCSKTSSFSKQIIEARQEWFEAERDKGAVRNVVDYFGRES